MRETTISYIWAILAMLTITVYILRRFIYRPDWIFLTLTLTANAQIPEGKYYVTGSTHSWFQIDYTEHVATGYMQERTSDHYERFDWYYEVRYKDDFKIVTLRMSNHSCTGVGEKLCKATYKVTGNTVTFLFDDGRKMTMKTRESKKL